MRYMLVVIGLAGLGCGAPGGSSRSADVSPSDTMIGAARAMTPDEIEDAQRVGTSVDTIVVSSTYLVLTPGQVFSLLELAPRGYDKAGQLDRSLQATFIVPETDVFEVELISLRALRAGVDTFFVEAVPRDPRREPRPRRPSTAIVVSVR